MALIGLLLVGAASSAQEPPNVAALRLAHLSPDAPLVDLLVDGQLVLKGAAFENVSSYLLVPAGRHEVKVFPHRPPAGSPEAAATDAPTTDASQAAPPQAEDATGQDRPDPAPKVAPLEPFTISVDLAAGGYYTLGMAGFFNPPAARTEEGSLSIEVDPGTSVRITGPRSYAVGLDRSQVLNHLEPGRYTVEASREGFQTARFQLNINPGEVTALPIDLQRGDAGSASEMPTPPAQEVGTPVWHRTQLQLYEDSFETFPPAGQVFVRAVHAAPGVSAVDIISRISDSVGTVESEMVTLLTDLGFPNASPYLSLPVGLQSLEVRLSGTDFVLAAIQDTQLIPGAFYTLYLIGTLNDQSLTLLPTVDAVLRGPLKVE